MIGYSYPEFDRICSTANSTIPGMTEHANSHLAAQAVFSQDLPSLPLYLCQDWVITRSDLYGVEGAPRQAVHRGILKPLKMIKDAVQPDNWVVDH